MSWKCRLQRLGLNASLSPTLVIASLCSMPYTSQHSVRSQCVSFCRLKLFCALQVKEFDHGQSVERRLRFCNTSKATDRHGSANAEEMIEILQHKQSNRQARFSKWCKKNLQSIAFHTWAGFMCQRLQCRTNHQGKNDACCVSERQQY